MHSLEWKMSWFRLKFHRILFPNGLTSNNPALVRKMAWRPPGNKPLSEPIHWRIYAGTRGKWVKKATAPSLSLPPFWKLNLAKNGNLCVFHRNKRQCIVIIISTVIVTYAPLEINSSRNRVPSCFRPTTACLELDLGLQSYGPSLWSTSSEVVHNLDALDNSFPTTLCWYLTH